MRFPRNVILRLFVKLVLAAVIVLVGLVVLYRFVNPPMSTLMIANRLSGQPVRQTWVPLDKISPHLVRTVITNEDARFCKHWGVDWGEVESAIKRAERTGDSPRGASTIPMQTVKNLFLWQRRSYVRKAIEIPLAYAASLVWPKSRMIEIYLNIAEWAPGVYGAEAAARHHFRTRAAKLTPAQAARLAAALPNPHVRNAGRPGPRTRATASRIAKRVAKAAAPLDCLK